MGIPSQNATRCASLAAAVLADVRSVPQNPATVSLSPVAVILRVSGGFPAGGLLSDNPLLRQVVGISTTRH